MSLDQNQQATPVVMAFSDHNSCGGSGVQADVETLFSIGCHCSSVPTALTAQDTHEFKDTFATEPAILIGQARAVLEDMMVAAFKIGRVESIRNIEVIHTILTDYPDPPIILEPAFTSLNRQVTANTIDAFRALLLPLATIVTVNVQEAHYLACHGDSLDACAHEILDSGCKYVLISGTNTDIETVTNTLYSRAGNIKSWGLAPIASPLSRLRFHLGRKPGCLSGPWYRYERGRWAGPVLYVEFAQEWQAHGHGTTHPQSHVLGS